MFHIIIASVVAVAAELSPEQIVLIGLIASAIAQILRFLFAWQGIQLSKLGITILLYVVALGLAILWNPPAFPPISDFPAFMTFLVNYVGGVVGWATIIYNVILDKIVLPYLKISSDQIKAKFAK